MTTWRNVLAIVLYAIGIGFLVAAAVSFFWIA
jgi:hypothetical protein